MTSILGERGAFLAKRLGQGLGVLAVVILFNFLLIRLAPGDVVDVLGATADMSPQQMAQLRQQYGLDESLPVQLVKYYWSLITFNLGYSPSNHASVAEVIAARLPNTMVLVVLSLGLSLTVGTAMGVVSAIRAGTSVDLVLSLLMLLIYATPAFVVALVMVLIFSVQLDLLPVSGLQTVGLDLTGWAATWDRITHLIMPVTALSAFYVAIYGRLSRASMLEALGTDFVRYARAKGVSRWRVTVHHALRNSMLPIVTMAGLQVSALLGGAVLIETVFSLPGMGRTAMDAVLSRDTNMLLGTLFVCSIGVLAVSFLVDILYVAIDPRIGLN